MTKYEYPSIGETLYRGALENGLRVSVITKPGYTRCFAMFATDYGGMDRRFRLGGEFTDTPAGVAHYLEHKMFDMPDGDNAMALLAGSGAQPNAFTSSAMTAYYFESTTGFYENLETLLRFVSTPWFTEESVQKERGIIEQEIRMGEDDPDHVVYDELMRCLYAHNPIRDTVAGTVESIAEITPETLYNCHRIFYNPSNMALCVAGDVDPERVEDTARRILRAEKGEAPERDYGLPEAETPARARFSRCMEVSAPQMFFGAKLRAEAGGEALLRQKMAGGLALNCLFGQSSPFYNRLYGEGLLNTDFGCGLDFSAGTLTMLAGGESRDPEKVFAQAMAEIEKAAREGIDPACFSRILKATYGRNIRALSSFAGLCMSMACADFGGYNFLDSFAVLGSLTAGEAREFVREQLRPERFAMSVIRPLSGAPEDA